MIEDPKAGAFSEAGFFGVAVALQGACPVGGWLVQPLSPAEMREMAEHLLVNARRSEGTKG